MAAKGERWEGGGIKQDVEIRMHTLPQTKAVIDKE